MLWRSINHHLFRILEQGGGFKIWRSINHHLFLILERAGGSERGCEQSSVLWRWLFGATFSLLLSLSRIFLRYLCACDAYLYAGLQIRVVPVLLQQIGPNLVSWGRQNIISQHQPTCTHLSKFIDHATFPHLKGRWGPSVPNTFFFGLLRPVRARVTNVTLFRS